MKTKHYSTISEFLADIGKPPPEHPLFTVLSVKADKTNLHVDCPELHQITTTDFYAISLKRIIEGNLLYGKSQYDCSSGTMLFLHPTRHLVRKE